MRRLVVLGVVLVFIRPAASDAQQPTAPQNLQVLRVDMPREQVIAVMRGFTAALGVECAYCHVEREGEPPDFVADDKPAKHTTRMMLKMVRDINDEYLAEVGANEPGHEEARVEVTCVTCHRGQEEPRLLPDVLSAVMEDDGIDAAIAQYRQLRARYYGSHTYDFSDQGLNELAERLIDERHTDEAFTVLNVNGEYHPDSARRHYLLGQAHLQTGNRETAIHHLKRSLELDPGSFETRQALNGLNEQGPAQPR